MDDRIALQFVTQLEQIAALKKAKPRISMIELMRVTGLKRIDVHWCLAYIAANKKD